MERRTYLHDLNARLITERLDGDHQRATLTFYTDELIYDIRNIAYIYGVAKSDKQPDVDNHLTFDIGEEGNVDRIARVLDLFFSEIQEALYPYTRSPLLEGLGCGCEMNQRDDVLDTEREEYTLNMVVPSLMSRHTLTYAENWIHEFLVCRAFAEWLMLIGDSSFNVWLEKAEMAKREVSRAMARRTGKIRRKMSPFV